MSKIPPPPTRATRRTFAPTSASAAERMRQTAADERAPEALTAQGRADIRACFRQDRYGK